MDTAAFLRHILPSKGYYFLAIPKGSGQGYRHTAFTTPEDLSVAALEASSNGINAFYAVAGFTHAEYLDEDGVKHWRETGNVHSARSFWMDIDCGTQYEGSQRNAIADLKRFCTEAKLPIPNFIVNSGNGVHVYWVMDRDIEKEMWRRAARVLKALAAKLQFATDDTTRTADISSVLRPIGTINEKKSKGLENKDVTLLRGNTEPVEFPAFLRALIDAQAKHGVAVSNSTPATQRTSDFASGMDYPPSSAHTIADRCSQIRFFRDFKGAGQAEPAWRACIGLVKFTTEGEDLCHEWSSGHDGYSKGECQSKIDGWKEKPTTCGHFKDANAAGCAGCTHKIKSPIRLGFAEPEHVSEIVHTVVDEVTEEVGQRVEAIPALPAEIQRRFRFNPTDGLTAKAQDKDGNVEWVPICTALVIAEDYYCDYEDGLKWKMKLSIRTRPFTWINADLDVRSIGQGGAGLMADLAAKTLATTRNPKLMEDYMKTWLEVVKAGQAELAMHNHMGWQVDNSFIAGDIRYMPDGTNRKVVLTTKLRHIVDKLGFERSGEQERYTELLGIAYNRPDHEAYHCSYLTAYASPLIALMEAAPTGIIFSAKSTKTGLGKSTVARIAAGVWHDPTSVVVAGRTTPYALYLNAGFRRNLLLVLDEITQWEKDKSADFAYGYSSGMSKEQGAAEGGLRDNAHLNWWNIVLCTGNESQHDNIRIYNSECQAQLARVFEYEFTTNHEGTMGTEEGRKVLTELMSMNSVYTAEFCEYITTNREAVTARLQTVYNKLMTAAELDKGARFWVIGCAAVWVAFEITKALGVHNFDGRKLFLWLVARLRDHAAMSKASSVDYVSMFGEALASLQTGFIVTTTYGTKLEPARIAAGWSIPRTAITGRVVQSDGSLALSVTALTNWCRDNKVDKGKVMTELRRLGWVRPDCKAKMVRLGGFTTLPSSPVRAYVLNWELFADKLGLTHAAIDPV